MSSKSHQTLGPYILAGVGAYPTISDDLPLTRLSPRPSDSAHRAAENSAPLRSDKNNTTNKVTSPSALLYVNHSVSATPSKQALVQPFNSQVAQSVITNATVHTVSTMSSLRGHSNASDILKCYSMSEAWSAGSVSFASAHLSTYTTWYTKSNCNGGVWSTLTANTYSLCDGVPRVRGAESRWDCDVGSWSSSFVWATETYCPTTCMQHR